jgi:anti-sigma factor RsiW
MARECSTEDLETLLGGGLAPDAAAELEAHVAACPRCRDELAWLRAEAELMARRRATQAAPAASQWDAIAARIQPPAPAPEVSRLSSLPRRWRWGTRVAYGLAAAAAAALLYVGAHDLDRGVTIIGSRSPTELEPPHKKLSPDAALDGAEREYQAAASVLEGEYKRERDRLPPQVALRYDRMLEKTRTRVVEARADAGNDVDGRMVVLDGYAEYVRSLQTIVADLR